jgi:hypothetical protein
LPRSAQNPNPATPGGERYRLVSTVNFRFARDPVSRRNRLLPESRQMVEDASVTPTYRITSQRDT